MSTVCAQALTRPRRAGHRAGMQWDDRLAGLFDDLEQQAEGIALRERDAEVAEARRAEYAQVDLATRLFGSVGAALLIGVTGVGVLDGMLRRVGDGWCLLDADAREWIVRLAAVGSVRRLAERGVTASSRPVTARLGFGSALRQVTDAGAEAVVHRLDGSVLRGAPGRVGADFLEVRGDAFVEVVPFWAVAAVRGD
jgi:hypothetical protein